MPHCLSRGIDTRCTAAAQSSQRYLVTSKQTIPATPYAVVRRYLGNTPYTDVENDWILQQYSWLTKDYLDPVFEAAELGACH